LSLGSFRSEKEGLLAAMKTLKISGQSRRSGVLPRENIL
jgi:hypothetical protein